VAPPRDIYDHPADAFVADFVGSLNEFVVACDAVADGRLTARLGEAGVLVALATDAARPGARVRVAVRPERIELGTGAANGASRVAGVVREVVYLGPLTRHVVHTAGAGTLRVDVLSDPAGAAVREGDEVVLTWNADAAIVLGPAT
jgi:ABC-type Fe3+/spermidine/putrescine transport system ATPase subunit